MTHFYGARRGVVARLPAVQPVTFVDKDRGIGFCGVSCRRDGFQKVDNIFPFPTEIVFAPDAGMRTAVAHRDENVVFLQFYRGFQNLFSADIHLDLRIIEVFLVADKDNLRIVVLNDFRFPVFNDVDNRESGIRHAPDRANRQSCGNGFHAVLDCQAFRHHRRNDFGRERRQNTCLYAAAQTVGKHDNRRIFVLFDDVDVIAA